MTEQEHEALRGLLGAWALRACLPDEAAEVERHLLGCAECAEEGERLRRAAGRLSLDDPLDQPDGLRQQVLDFCLNRRAAQHPLAGWAAPFAAETAKLDALLRDLGPAEWQELAELPWRGGSLRMRPAEVLCHLAALDGLVGTALGLPDPGGSAWPRVPAQASGPAPWGGLLDRGERLAAEHAAHSPQEVRQFWRAQSQALLRGAVPEAGDLPVDYGFTALPVRDAFIDRAFETWMHGEDVARAVAYPYAQPAPGHLRQMVDLAARQLPGALVGRRQAAYAGPGPAPGSAPAPPAWQPEGAPGPGRTVRLVIEGPAAGQWLIPLDGRSTAPEQPPVEPVAELVMDGVEFCQLAAAHRDPEHLPVGEYGDRAAIREVLAAVPLLSRP
ncbi:MDMPI N domain containing protein [Kitasatospora sp. RB6PN24]|uniref:maleylpyruvate isomerase N-terminal domain-containing protein n=1 Tax=Kitasatospora humi TaxID=2893891 RepID=UPI001E29B609|nr:maleylpyruvate isomerase N-terminal domain-containing protein [Kitasatospora humi]MCC9306727.1 MDMPI N domain containing protein [Kitasatospora humi]